MPEMQRMRRPAAQAVVTVSRRMRQPAEQTVVTVSLQSGPVRSDQPVTLSDDVLGSEVRFREHLADLQLATAENDLQTTLAMRAVRVGQRVLRRHWRRAQHQLSLQASPLRLLALALAYSSVVAFLASPFSVCLHPLQMLSFSVQVQAQVPLLSAPTQSPSSRPVLG